MTFEVQKKARFKMGLLTWDDVLANHQLIGGDIETQDEGTVYRGPISKIERDGVNIKFTSAWTARLKPGAGVWKKWDIIVSTWNTEMVQPQDFGEGRVLISMPFIGICILFPKGRNLDPKKVEGLPKASERFLALYPDLRFDRKIINGLIRIHMSKQGRKAFLEQAAPATLLDVLNCFSEDSSAEEFLWDYVEKITGDEESYMKVY